MKSLNLKGQAELLTKEQMKKVLGGAEMPADCPPDECNESKPCSAGYHCENVACKPGGDNRQQYHICIKVA